MNDGFPVWRLFNNYLKEHGPLHPLQMAIHGSQKLYSWMKGVCNGATLYITQSLNSVVSNAYVLWKTNRDSDKLDSTGSDFSIDRFRMSINRNVSFRNSVL